MRKGQRARGRSYNPDEVTRPTPKPPGWTKTVPRVVLRTNDCDFGVVKLRKGAKLSEVCWKTSRGYQTVKVRTECIIEAQEIGA